MIVRMSKVLGGRRSRALPAELDSSASDRLPSGLDGQEVGTISAVVFSHRLQRTVGIGQIKRSVVESGAVVDVQTPHGLTTASITSLPFI